MAYRTIYNPGSFNQFIEIQEFVKQKNEYGLTVENWVTVRKTRCMTKNNMSTSRMEYFKASGINTTNIKEFIVRYKQDFGSKCRVIYKNNIYNIIKVDNIDEESRYQQISAKLVD